MDDIRELYDNITLSPAADGRIRSALEQAVRPVPAHGRRRPVRKGLRISVLAAVTAGLLTVTALAAGVIRIVQAERSVSLGFQDSDETVAAVDVGFDRTDQDPIAPLGVWTVDVPDGYARIGGVTQGDYTENNWKNDRGARLSFRYEKAGAGLGNVTLTEESIREKRSVTVGDLPGTLYVLPGGSLLAWVDEQAGIGFMLTDDGGGLDLPALAETVSRTADRPEPDENALAALAQLGDWTVTALPDGYGEYAVQGMPAEYGGEDQYAYVRRYYSDADGRSIELDHEASLGDCYNSYVQYYRDNGDISQEELDVIEKMGVSVQGLGCTVTDVTVQGRPAGLVTSENGIAIRLAWLSEDGATAFILSSDSLTADQMLAAAESVKEQ